MTFIKILVSLVTIVALFIGGFLYIIHRSADIVDTNITPPLTVKDIETYGPIYLDIAVDDNRNIHLAYETVESGIYYQNSSDMGATWSDPTAIFIDTSFASSRYPRILQMSNKLIIFWMANGLTRRVSSDGGLTWIEKERVISKYSAQHSILLSEGDIIYRFYNSINGFFFQKSEDYGANWTPPLLINPDRGNSVRMPCATVEDGVLYVFWNLKDRLFYRKSDDQGENWEDIRIIDIRSGKNGWELEDFIPDHFTTANNRGILTLLRNNSLYYISSNDNGNRWSYLREINGHPVEGVDLCANDNGAYVFWIDRRHRKRDWWSYIPFHFLLTWDKSPNWINNDLYYAFLENGEVAKTERLTGPLSYVNRRINTISSAQYGSGVVVFWSGMREVGKTLSESDMPYEIFYNFIE